MKELDTHGNDEALRSVAMFRGLSSDEIRDAVAWRHHLHQNPEIAFKEHGTAAFVAAKLQAWGYRVRTGLAGTGVVGSLTEGFGQKAIGLRADMDALPIEEASSLPYRSAIPGTMHACGHDGHVAMLLAAER